MLQCTPINTKSVKASWLNLCFQHCELLGIFNMQNQCKGHEYHFVLSGFCFNHRYTTEVPEPASSWSRHEAQIGVFRFLYQNNRGSSGACVTCMYCSLSVMTNTHKTPSDEQRSSRHLFCVYFCVWSADDAITHDGIGGLGSLVYICGVNRVCV